MDWSCMVYVAVASLVGVVWGLVLAVVMACYVKPERGNDDTVRVKRQD